MPQFTNNLEESLQKARQELAVLENLRKQTLAAPTQPRLLEELNNTIKSLTPEEREKDYKGIVLMLKLLNYMKMASTLS